MSEDNDPVGTLTHGGVDVADIERAAAFYSALLGVKRGSAWDQYLAFEPLPGGLTVYFQRVPEKKTSKTRVHMDLTVPDVLGPWRESRRSGEEQSGISSSQERTWP